LDFWDVPSQKKLSEFEHKKVLNRIVKYASAWGNVSVDTKPVPRREELKAELKEAGIEYEEYEDGIIGFSSTIETEKTRKGGFLRRK
jgi:ubiquinone/menaquinone biosynthesis C-methylase UbiE